jgi:hypothetical protein
MNEVMGTRGRVRFRDPDPVAKAGSRVGFRAAIQRPAADGFEDLNVARDVSPALPGMELVLYNGDSSSGTGRQFLHLAGVEAAVSYGIACLYGQRADGRCSAIDDLLDTNTDTETVTTGDGETQVVTVTEPGETVFTPATAPPAHKSLIRRIVEAPVRLLADALRLLFSNPREFGLMAAVWALLYAPCWLGERRRSIRDLRARRIPLGAAP